MFRLSLLSFGLTQVLNSLRSRKHSDHNAVKLSYELNFRHSRFISYLSTIHSQGLLHFSHGIHFNHFSRNSFSFIKSRFTEHKKPDHGAMKKTLAPPPPPPPPLLSLTCSRCLAIKLRCVVVRPLWVPKCVSSCVACACCTYLC